jgi:hypothetical protein
MTYLSDLRSLGEGGLFSFKINNEMENYGTQLAFSTIPKRAGLVKRRARAGLDCSSIILTCLLHTFWLEKV